MLTILEICGFILSIGVFYGLNHYVEKKYDLVSSHIYFILHFFVNLFISITILTYIFAFISDPLGIKYDLDQSSYNPSYNIIYWCYPILAGLHTFHVIIGWSSINLDEKIHHILTYVFWIIIHNAGHPIYVFSLLGMSGIAGGLTYLMLFFQKFNMLVTKEQEKYISYIVNIWIRSPLCIIFATLYLCRMSYLDDLEEQNIYNTWGMVFVSIFTIVNGIHFGDTITKSYYFNHYLTMTKN